MPILNTLRAFLGWCPMAGPSKVKLPVHPEFDTAADIPAGDDGTMAISHGWWNRYHNQVLVTAVIVSASAAALVLRVGELPEYYMHGGIAIGIGSAIGFLLSYRKRYARVAAGAFARAGGNWKKRVIRYMKSLTIFSAAASIVVIAVGVAFFALLGMPGPIFAFLLGMSITWWALYCITVFWERGHRMTLVSDGGWMYAVDSAMTGDNGEGIRVR
ncbi:MAG: DUF1673 family protein [Methanomicrobiaceae archaeon]|nr:DUF1673 family protein [Methanomicrobiaceae archaeon]